VPSYTILQTFSKTSRVCDIVKLNILERVSLPLLLYGVDSGILNEKLLISFNKCWNIVYRKIFGYFSWESVKGIMAKLNKLNVICVVYLRRIVFIKRWFCSTDQSNPFHNFLLNYINHNEFQSILHKFNINFHSSIGNIKHSMHASFSNSCEL